MRVRDLMSTPVTTLEASDRLDLAGDIMHLGRVRHMPVVSNGCIVGLISQRDLFRAGISSVLHLRRAAEQEWLATIEVKEVMTRHVVTIAPEASIEDAVDMMLAREIGCLPVVEDGKLVGLLSESDCMRYLARVLELAGEKDALPELSRPA